MHKKYSETISSNHHKKWESESAFLEKWEAHTLTKRIKKKENLFPE